MDDPDLAGIIGEAPQDELWLISYADLLTVLVGFFVLLLGASGVKAARFERIAAAISGAAAPPPLETLRGKIDDVVRAAGLTGRVVTREDAEGLGIEFKDALLFDSGSADLRPDAHAVISDVARLLRELPGRPVTVEGHTDEVPIGNARFRSNWELSAQRAINVLQALEEAGVPRDRLSARGHADTRPLPGRDLSLDQQRSANRRVVIRVE